MNKKTIIILVGLNILLIATILIFSWGKIKEARDRQHRTEFRIKKWPEERRLAEEKIKSRQLNDETSGAATINLKPYINAALTDCPSAPATIKDNNLAELPLGLHIYGGVPFDVQGMLQLTGRGMLIIPKNYPESINDIKIGKSCNIIYLLHAAFFIDETSKLGKTVAKIVLHYVDGTDAELDIASGKQVGDWWAPLMTSGIDPQWVGQLAPGTEIAWAGDNPCIKQYSPDKSIVLYKTSFKNPFPEKIVASLDYVSTLTYTAPFMVGLTVE